MPDALAGGIPACWSRPDILPAMPETADLLIEPRWILPMDSPGRILTGHALLVANGRILDILPGDDAAHMHPQAARISRPTHLLMPGLINPHARTTASLPGVQGGPVDVQGPLAPMVRDATMLSIARMLRGGITCFADMGFSPDETASIAAEQGIRTRVGLPVSGCPGPWARDPAGYLSRALRVRDDLKGHPRIDFAFAPRLSGRISDETLEHVRTLADELEAPISLCLHETPRAVRESLSHHGLRPIQRLEELGLLGPSLNAIHMTQVCEADLELARRCRINITLCPASSPPPTGDFSPVRLWIHSGLPVGLGSDGPPSNPGHDLWREMRLAARLCAEVSDDGMKPLPDWAALALVTCGAAQVLGLADRTGTLEPGKWADMCCVDFSHPVFGPVHDPIAQLVQHGGGDSISDVWVAGRPLLESGELTRIDWPSLRERVQAWFR